MRSPKLNEEQSPSAASAPSAIEAFHQLERRRLANLVDELERRRKDREGELNAGVPGLALAWLSRELVARLSGGLAASTAPLLWTAAAAADAVGFLAPAAEPLQARAAGALATIIILNYEGRELLERNLPSVLAAVEATGLHHEVLVVDNGSADGSLKLIRDQFPAVRWLGLDRNYFFSAGNNAGVRVAKHDLIVLLNNDMRVEPDFLGPLLAPFAEADDVFAVASQIFFSKPGKRREETGLTTAHFSNGWIQLGHAQVSSFLRQDPVPTFWAGGGACAFDRRKYNDLGGLDVLYDPFYCEDADLSFRAWQSGWRVLFAPRSIVHHEHRSTSSRVFGEKFVNETFRRNHFLLHWANLREPELLAQHLLELPSIVSNQVRREGWSGANSFLRALRRAPRAIARRARARRPGPGDREILDIAAAVEGAEGARPSKRLSQDKKLRIVVLTPYAFYPQAHGGAVFTYNLIRGLTRRGHEVSLLGFVDDEDQRRHSGHLEEFCREVHLRIRGQGTRRPDPLQVLPSSVHEFDQLEFAAELRSMLDRLDPDVLHVEYTQMATYARGSTRRINTISEHDVAFLSAHRSSTAARGVAEKARLHLDYLKMFRFETSILKGFDVVFATSSKEAELLASFGGLERRVSSVPFAGMDLSRYSRPPLRRTPSDELLFVGSFRHTPNVDALRFFVRDVLPRIHEKRPGTRLVVAGTGSPPEVRALAADPRVEIRGFVPDLQPLYDRCAAFIAPIRVGAGIRVKLLEAFAAGAPAVSTTLGAEGIGAEHGRELLIADGPRDFAAAVLGLLGDPGVGTELSHRAYDFVARFGMDAISGRMEAEFRRALTQKRVMLP